MNAKKAKTIRKIAFRLSRGQDFNPEMKVKKNAVFKEVVGDDGKKKKQIVKNAKFQRTLNKAGATSIRRRLKRLYIQRKIRISIDRKKI